MNINVENNTNIVGGVVANVVNAKTPSLLEGEGLGEGLIDGGNLSINTKTLTYSDLNNYNNMSEDSFGINVALPIGLGSQISEGGNGKTKVEWGKSLEVKSNLSYVQIGINYVSNSSEQTGETKATIGQGVINLSSNITRDEVTGELISIIGGRSGQEILGDSTSTLSEIASATNLTNLNRDINNNQITNDTTYEGGYNINLNLTPGLVVDAYDLFNQDKLWNTAKTNVGGTGEKLYGLTPMGVNRDIEATRGSEQSLLWGESAVYKSGTEWNGVLDPKANNIGLANIADPEKGQVPGQLVPLTIKTFFSGNEGGIISLSCNYLVPGCNDMSLTHDNWGGSQIVKNIPLGLQLSIIPAYPYNTYGLIGKPVNILVDYIRTPASTINLNQITDFISVPTINLKNSQ